MADRGLPEAFVRLPAALDAFMEGRKFPGRVLFSKVWGSYSHNTELPESDIDYLVVYACTPQELLSLNPPPETVDGQKPDFQAHEAWKFASLLLKGNPGVVECLFTDIGFTGSPEWAALRSIRKSFLNQQTLKQYLGYCRGQLHRMDAGTRLHTKGGEFNTKWAYHMIRLAHDAERIARGAAPEVYKTGDERALLMDVRHGKFGPDRLAAMYTEIETRIDARKPWPIPEGPNVGALNEWLMGVYGLPAQHIETGEGR